jgi:hypothetical protein
LNVTGLPPPPAATATATAGSGIERVLHPREREAEIVADRVRVAAVGGIGATERLGGFAELALLHQEDAQVVPGGDEQGVLLDGAAQEVLGLAQAPQAEVRRAHGGQRVGGEPLAGGGAHVGV